MKCSPEKNDPFSFEGPEIYKSTVIVAKLIYEVESIKKKHLNSDSHIAFSPIS